MNRAQRGELFAELDPAMAAIGSVLRGALYAFNTSSPDWLGE